LKKTTKVEKFINTEKLLFKITLILFGSSFFLFAFTFFIIDSFQSFTKSLINITFTLFLISGLHFFINLFRIFKYFIKNDILKNEEGIWRSVLGIVLTPVTFGVLWILMIIISLSSCAVSN